MPSTVERARNRYAVASRIHGSSSAEAVTARADLAAEKIAAYVERVVADAPPLRPEQLDRIVRALSCSRVAGVTWSVTPPAPVGGRGGSNASTERPGGAQ